MAVSVAVSRIVETPQASAEKDKGKKQAVCGCEGQQGKDVG
jgi:hypothetical protein